MKQNNHSDSYEEIVYTKRHRFVNGSCEYCLVNEKWYRTSKFSHKCRGIRQLTKRRNDKQ